MPSFSAEGRASGEREPFVPQAPPSARPGPGGFVPGSAASAPPPAAEPAPDLETVRREAHEAGRAEGYEAGRAAGRAEVENEALASAASALEEAARGVAALRRTYLLAHRRALVDLALAVAERILGRALDADPDALASLVERALGALGDAGASELRLAPRDLELLEGGALPRLAQIAESHAIAVRADPRLSPGDARVLAGSTEVDARTAELLRRVRDELAALLEREESPA